jgi:hypothetical protein
MTRSLVLIMVVACSAPLLGAADGPAERVVIPAAASSAGVQGAYWQTELLIFNPTDDLVTAVVEVLPDLGDTAPPPAVIDLPIPPDGTRVVSDVLGRLFPGVEFGALVIRGLGPEGEPAPVIASSRTWSPADGAGCGQALSGLAWAKDDPAMSAARVLDGLVSGPFRRANLGIVNLSDRATVRFSVELAAVDGEAASTLDVTVPPRGARRLTDVVRAAGLDDGAYDATVRILEAVGADPDPVVEFMVYGSVIDRQTNRPTTLQVRSLHRSGPDGLDTESADGLRGAVVPTSLVVVGLAADAHGASELWLENRRETETAVRLEILDAVGIVVAATDLTLPPATLVRHTSALARHGLVGDGFAARLTLIDGSGDDPATVLGVSGTRGCGDERSPVDLSVAPVVD